MKKKLYLSSLGCVRNQVNSEVMLGKLIKNKWDITDDPKAANAIVINTCGFIRSAIDESIDTILKLAEYKEKGKCKKLIVAGCLSERYGKKIVPTMPEVDVFLGTGSYDKIAEVLETSEKSPRYFFDDPNMSKIDILPERIFMDSHLAYVKVSEGCNRHCTYCVIPKLRGKQRSRRINDIVQEVDSIILKNIKEVLLVAENTTDYGTDLTPSVTFNDLLKKLSDINHDLWLRILYGHPDSMDASFIKTIALSDRFCSYFDLPIQHASDTVLKKMGRHYKNNDLYNLFKLIRETAPDSAIRTTVIVGFPGETEEDFKILYDFVKHIKFDHLGVFKYSDSDDIASHHLPNHVPDEIAENRHDMLMEVQQEISLNNNQKYIGKTYRVLVEENLEKGLYLGRTFFQAPEVDGVTFIYHKYLETGDFVDVKITDAYEYDLAGEIE